MSKPKARWCGCWTTWRKAARFSLLRTDSRRFATLTALSSSTQEKLSRLAHTRSCSHGEQFMPVSIGASLVRSTHQVNLQRDEGARTNASCRMESRAIARECAYWG